MKINTADRFFSGSPFKGEVVLSLDKPYETRSVVIELHGVEKVEWDEVIWTGFGKKPIYFLQG